jgi:hypothetical protein
MNPMDIAGKLAALPYTSGAIENHLMIFARYHTTRSFTFMPELWDAILALFGGWDMGAEDVDDVLGELHDLYLP